MRCWLIPSLTHPLSYSLTHSLSQRVVREKTPGPSFPQTPAGGLSTWSTWSCNEQILPLIRWSSGERCMRGRRAHAPKSNGLRGLSRSRTHSLPLAHSHLRTHPLTLAHLHSLPLTHSYLLSHSLFAHFTHSLSLTHQVELRRKMHERTARARAKEQRAEKEAEASEPLSTLPLTLQPYLQPLNPTSNN